jgi:hypothetical protein
LARDLVLEIGHKVFISMATTTEEVRRAILRSLGKARKSDRIAPATALALRSRCFPLTFFVRNLLTLQQESGWLRASGRFRKRRALHLLEERARIFLAVQRWIRTRQGKAEWRKQFRLVFREMVSPEGYCSHCGGCCEIASGFPDFPPETEIPLRWQRIFGDGLGRNHRFCAFLWEWDASGRSLCAIHPWRSNPCRIFDEEECQFFMKDLETNPLFDPKAFSVACQRLSHLINRG